MSLTPVLTDAKTMRERIRAQALEGLRQAFPLTVRGDHQVTLEDLKVHERDFGPSDQKRAKLDGSTLHEPVKATLLLKDGKGTVLERVKNTTLLHLPYFTERHTFMVDGNEYQVSNQLRMKPGVYTRRRANDELEAAFNLAKGANFRLSLDPQRGHPYMEYGTTRIPLYPILRHLGIPHFDIARAWGAEVASNNQAEFERKKDQHLEKLYTKVVHPSKQTAASLDQKVIAIRHAYDATIMDPEVNHVTLGAAHERVTPRSLLDASSKLLAIYKSGDDLDDRDSLAFKTFHSVDDFIKERIGLDARLVAMKARGRAASKTALRDLIPSAPFSAGLRSFLTGSQLSAIPTQINPMEVIDHAVKITSLGEGGISNERAIPMEARQLHSTHLGILDPVRTPESFKAGVDIRATVAAHRDAKGNLYTGVRNVRTRKMEYVSAKQLQNSCVAFPGQKLQGVVDAMDHGHLAHVPASRVDFEFTSPAQFYSPSSSLIPMIESIQGNRATMGSKMQTQALPLVDREVPWVQSGARNFFAGGGMSNFEKELGKLIVPVSPVSGKVVKIDDQYVYIDPTGKRKHAADTLNAAHYTKATQRKPEHALPPELLPHVHLQAVGKLGQYLVYEVDGKFVRDQVDLEFGAGGNPGHYGYVPENELWVSADPAERAAVALDQFLESELMRNEGLSHDAAHEQAKAAVRLFRTAHPTASLYDAQQWLGALTQEKVAEIEKLAGGAKRQKTIKGITFKLELEPGDKRTGKSPDGKVWEKEMSVCYGYVPKTQGDDGEAVDVYLKEDGFFGQVWVIHQLKRDGTHDEDKCMVGFSSYDEAVVAYRKHGPEWGLGEVSEYDWNEFRDVYLDVHTKTASFDTTGLTRVPYETNFPFASKTYLHHDLTVKPGDHIKADTPLADSNFTRNGELALGKNMTVGYMAYYGLNSNDAVVISDNAAKKLTSEHMYTEVMDVEQGVTLGKELHRQWFGTKYSRAAYDKLDAKGVIKRGQKVLPHDPVIVGVRKTKPSSADALLGNLKKSLVAPYREEVRTWHHDFEGEVIDVFESDRRVVVTVKTREPMRIGDKLAGRFGNKGVVSHIVPDSRMIHDEGGQPVDILYTSQGVISRINPAQIIETALAKVAKKTGKPIVMENFSGKNNVAWAKELLKKHDVKDKETVFDPVSGKKIPGVLVGPQYTFRLFKTTDSNYSARGTGSYDVNQQPTKGGDDGAKGLGKMEVNALIAHNARNVLREASSIKSQKNDEFWRAAQLGLPLPPLKPAFAFNKMVGMLTGAGVRVHKDGHHMTLMPLTDNDITEMSSGAIENEKLVRAKDLHPERGGLFDPSLTGGTTGTQWSHVDLAEPMVSPVFFEPARRLLGMTNKDFENLMHTKGGHEVKLRLNAIDVVKRIAELRRQLKTVTGSKVDDIVKQLKYLEALKKANLRPGDAYVLGKLPVLPPIMRPILPGKGGKELVVGDSNYLYQSAMLHNRALDTQNKNPILPPDEHATLRKNLFTAVGAVIGTHETDNPKLQKRQVKGFLEHLTGKTTPKSSYFQKKIVKRQQDMSGRGTAAPDGSLGMNEIGMPEEMLWVTFEKFVIARLVRRGFPALQAKDMVDNRHPAARDALLAECAERPVMVNRAPTLHRYNIVAAYAQPVAGKTIRVNPFIEKGMNLDYDGDTLQVHVPVLPGAIQDTKQMTLSQLIFGDRDKNQLMVAPTMEAALGIHMASKGAVGANGKVHKFRTKEDAVAAYRRGEITLHDRVKVGG